MRIFGRRSQNSSEPSPAQENFDAARAALREGNASEALRLLSFAFAQDAAFKPLYEMARDTLQRMEAPEEAALFDQALRQFEQAKPFFDLGYHFIDSGNDRLAVPFLERAHALAPDDAIIANEFALALCGQFQPQRALEVMDKVLSSCQTLPFWPAYQRCWAKLLCNQPEGVRDWLDQGYALLQTSEIDEEQKSNTRYALDKLAAVLKRLQAVPERRPVVQDWHFIQYGAAILDFMDDRITEDGMDVAGGRHVSSWGQVDDIRLVLEKLKEFLSALDLKPQRVVALQDRDSQIIGLAAAKVLSLPFQSADENNTAQPHTLIVAADNRAIDFDSLRRVAVGQTLFAFNHHWLQSSAITPDVCGLMSQTYGLPWQGGGMRIDPETQELTRSEADERDAEIIAQEIVDAPFEADPSWPSILQFYVERRQLLTAGHAAAPRLPFLTDSPVPGSYFC